MLQYVYLSQEAIPCKQYAYITTYVYDVQYVKYASGGYSMVRCMVKVTRILFIVCVCLFLVLFVTGSVEIVIGLVVCAVTKMAVRESAAYVLYVQHTCCLISIVTFSMYHTA